MSESVRKTFQKTARMRGVDAAWADIEAEVERLREGVREANRINKESYDLAEQRNEARGDRVEAKADADYAEGILCEALSKIPEPRNLKNVAAVAASDIIQLRKRLQEAQRIAKEWIDTGTELNLQNGRLLATVATVRTLAEERKGDGPRIIAPINPEKILELLDADMEVVRVTVGDGWTVTVNDGKGSLTFKSVEALCDVTGTKPGDTLLLVPMKKK